jgi:hypothetical protein
LLTSNLVMMLSHLQLNVDLWSTDPRFLLLLIGLLLDGEVLHPWLEGYSLNHDRRDGLEC